jgi:hypothetical protein
MLSKSGFQFGLAVVFLLIFIAACSGGSNPVTGNNAGSNNGLTSAQSVAVDSHRVLWGYYNCVIDVETKTVEAVPARGVMMHVNAVEWMQPPGGSTSNLQITIVDGSNWLTQGRFDLDVGLKHPFAGLDQFTGFDVMGVFITDGHKSLASQVGVTYNDGGTLDATMLNPDGYTRWWNQEEFDDPTIKIFSYIPGALGYQAAGLNARINPYKYFTDSLTALADEGTWLGTHASQRGMFGAGELNVRRYQLKWPMVGGNPQLRFDYAVVASWEAPTPNPPTVIPGDFPYSANALEPVALSVADNSNLFYTTAQAGGGISLDLEVYDWAELKPGQIIPDTISRIVVESISPNLDVAPPLGYFEQNSSSWNVTAGAVNSSVWHVDIPSLTPTASGPTPVLVILETDYNYDNGFGTGFPSGKLSSYFQHTLDVSPFNPGLPAAPTCTTPDPEWDTRNVLDLEEYTSTLDDINGDPFNVDWSVVPSGDPPYWENKDVDTIVVNWWNATTQGTLPGDYDVCVSVYGGDGLSECCLTVTVDPLPTIEPLTGQNDLTPNPQPDQGTQLCDIAVANPGSGPLGSVGEIMSQSVTPGSVRMYKFSDNYSAPIGIVTLDNTGLPGTQFDDVLKWKDFKHFEVTPSNATLMLHVTSGSNTQPSFPAPPNALNINDPMHVFVMPYWNGSGVISYLSMFGDIGSGGGSPDDPDSSPWKRFCDWSSGVIGGIPGMPNTREYGLYAISELWAGAHPGAIYLAYSNSPYNNPASDLKGLGLPGMSTQYTSPPGPIDDNFPQYMALGVDDDTPVVVDWDPGTGFEESPLVVWYMLSGENSPPDRKVHLVWMPQDYSIGAFAYDDFIGTGSGWGLDFGGATPIDLEVVYAGKANSGLNHQYNWIAVLLNTGTSWRVDVFRYEPIWPTFVKVGSYNGSTGTPQAMDVDAYDNEMHVLYRDTLNVYKITVLHFVP